MTVSRIVAHLYARAPRRVAVTAASIGICAGLAVPATAAAAAGAPAWKLTATPMPATLIPGSDGAGGAAYEGPIYQFSVTNVGAVESSGTTTLTVTFPDELTPYGPSGDPYPENHCAVEPAGGQVVVCTLNKAVGSSEEISALIPVEVAETASGTLTPEATVSGGGAPDVTIAVPTPVGTELPSFDFLPGDTGFSAPVTDETGGAATQAGSHPYQMTVDVGTNVESVSEVLTGAGNPRDLITNLPRGMVVDPAATVRCTAAELAEENAGGVTAQGGCPDASAIGLVTVTTEINGPVPVVTPLYNMVPPPGSPSDFAFDAIGVGIYVHLLGGVRSDGDYGLFAAANDLPAFGLNPIFHTQVQLWGDPSASSHDKIRGTCVGYYATNCPVEPQSTAFLTMPSQCTGPTTFSARANSWEEPGTFVERQYESADLAGNPVPVDGCNQLEFKPTISARPTTDAADSPTGLEFDLRQPQQALGGEALSGRATASLRDATVTLPEGLVANPSQADGLAVCTEEEIGYRGEGHYSKQPQGCPDAAKLGTLEVSSPLLAEYTEAGTKPATDPQTGEPIARPLKGSVYLAKPFDNQFGTLLALYLAVEDEQSGIVAKLAGKVLPDPTTGQLTAVFKENPQLPLSDVHLSLFKGARAALTTPLTCGSHATTSTLTPWSAPEGQDAHPTSSFQTSSEPGGGICPTSEGAAPNAPFFTAGTVSPQAGAYSPFLLRISRQDGSQRLTRIDTLLPEGLTGRLAGIGQCSDAQLALAESRSHPEEGILERNSPSCPATSEVGTVTVAAGSGPNPFHTAGHAYLAGPYKGAPLSLAVIVPAVAGPFDLGAVVTRVALYVEPETTRIHAVSDPLPTILEGIPLDLRSIELRMGRPGFTLNPTSCDPMAITGAATSTLGQPAALSERFQVGGCSALPFKPKLSLRLKGRVRRTAHPRLIANLRAKEGEANIARAQVKLPHSAFLDQNHIKTICTRVQWAADTCPAGSVYGSVWATTPLLPYRLTGQVYLRSSSNKLPDLVAKLKGPAWQPIEIDLDGRTDSVKGALRNTFEAVPDAPVSAFHLELFGGKRGLVEMSSGFCENPHATVHLTGQNGKVSDTRPVVAAKCPRKHRRHHKKRHGHHRHSRGGHRST